MNKEKEIVAYLPNGLDMQASCMEVGKAINESGLSDRYLAERLGVTVQSINRWRHGHAFPDVENLYLLSRIVGKLVDDFLVPIGGKTPCRHTENSEKLSGTVGTNDMKIKVTFVNPTDTCRRLFAYYERLCA